MTARRLILLGLVIAVAVLLGFFLRREVAEQEASAPAPSTPPAVSEITPNTVAPLPEDPAQAESGPGFDVVRVEPGGESIIAGRTKPGAEVELLAGGEVIARATANEAGEFVIMPAPLKPGSHELTLRTDGNLSRQAVTVSVPQPGQGEVLVVVGEPGQPSKVVQAGAPQGPEAGALSAVPGFVSEPAAANTPLRIGAIEAGGGRLFVQGSGSPGASAVIYLNDAPLAEARIGPDGRWSLTVEQGLAKGEYRVRIDQIGEGGQVVARAEVPFTATADTRPAAPETAAAPQPETAPTAQETPAPVSAEPDAAPSAPATVSEPQPAAPAPEAVPAREAAAPTADPVVPQINTVEVQRGDNLWRISRRIYGEGIRYSVIYEANNDQIRDPHRIYPGQIFVTPER